MGANHSCYRDCEPTWNWRPFRYVSCISSASFAMLISLHLDLHAAPGKQNNDAHAGTSEPPTFFSSKQHRQHTLHVLRVLLLSLISHSPPLPNVIGIELLNEPSPPSASSHTILKEWYASAIKELNALDPNMPLYIGDCWCTDEYAEFIESLPGTGQEDGSFVVLDHHLYRCFTDSDIHTSAESHAQALSNPGAPTHQTFARVTEKIGRARRGGGLVIGEWSGALNPGSMTGDHGEWRRYIEAQLGLYEMTCAGWFFWTFRKQGEGDAGWSFRDAVRGGEFPQFVGLRVKQQYSSAQINGEQERERRERVRDEERDKALGRLSFPDHHCSLFIYLPSIPRSCPHVLLVAVSWEICTLALRGRLHAWVGGRMDVLRIGKAEDRQASE